MVFNKTIINKIVNIFSKIIIYLELSNKIIKNKFIFLEKKRKNY